MSAFFVVFSVPNIKSIRCFYFFLEGRSLNVVGFVVLVLVVSRCCLLC